MVSAARPFLFPVTFRREAEKIHILIIQTDQLRESHARSINISIIRRSTTTLNPSPKSVSSSNLFISLSFKKRDNGFLFLGPVIFAMDLRCTSPCLKDTYKTTGANLAYDLQKLKYIPDPLMKQSIHESVLASTSARIKLLHPLPEQTP